MPTWPLAPDRVPQVRDAFGELVATARTLQGPDGCPWDRVQTVASLLPHLVEEAWEAYGAGRIRRPVAFREELGDVLYTVVFLSLLAERQGWFTLEGLLDRTRHKMIRRHPHVFGTRRARSPAEAYAAWQQAKRREGRRRTNGNLRPLLTAIWEALRRTPGAAQAFEATLGRLGPGARRMGVRRVSGRSRRSSARSAPSRGR